MSEITDILEQQADLLFQNISGWERRTLEYIGARIKKTGKLSMADAKAINNIAIIEKDMEAIIKDLARVTWQNISEIRRIYSGTINSQHNANKVLYDYLKRPFIPFADDKRLQAMVRAYAKTTAETMINISKTKALGFVDEFGRFTDMKTTLHNALSKAVVEVASGATDFNTAMRRTVETLGGSGIRVNYGGGITRRLDSAVRQNILWGAKQASNEYNEMIGEELGCDGIEIDWHSNPRPSHEFMQGKQYSLSGKKTVNGITYESAERALAALEDYGCLHFKTPIILGVSDPRFSEEDLAELNRQNSEPITINGVTKSGYEWKQGMRRLESAVREQETIKATAKASGNNILADECDERIKAFKNKYNEISKATGIAKQPNRMSASKAKNSLTNIIDGSIIKENEHFVSSSEYAVKKGLTSSREFISKVQSLADLPELKREYYSEVKQMLEHRSGTNGEDLKLYNPRLKKWYRSTSGTEAGRPEYNDEILLGINEALPNELIAFHNHPAGMPPSANDLNAALDNKYAKAYTIGHNGKIFEYIAPKYKIEKYSYDVRINKNKLPNVSDYEAQIKTLDEIKNMYEFEYKEVLVDD